MKIIGTSRPELINSLLTDALEKKKEFMIWQRTEERVVRFQVKANLVKIKSVGVYEFDLQDEVHFSSELPVYFAIMDSTLVFKTGDVQSFKKLLTLNIPSMIKYKERRKHPRKNFKYQEKKHVEVVYTPMNEMNSEEPKTQTEIIDISKGGMCILMTKELYDKLDKSQPLSLKSLSSDVQLASVYARIMNMRPYKGPTLSKGDTLAIGLMFITPED